MAAGSNPVARTETTSRPVPWTVAMTLPAHRARVKVSPDSTDKISVTMPQPSCSARRGRYPLPTLLDGAITTSAAT